MAITRSSNNGKGEGEENIQKPKNCRKNTLNYKF